jgi:hypothetical protein
VFLAALGFGVAGWNSGALDGWLATVAWETGPEHWHGNADPTELLARVVPFYETWLAYAGALPVLVGLGALAVAVAGDRAGPALRGARVWAGTAALYSLLLCTIDHSPSHYFLPLLHLPVVALACVSSGLPGRWARVALAAVAVVGLWISVTGVPVSG